MSHFCMLMQLVVQVCISYGTLFYLRSSQMMLEDRDLFPSVFIAEALPSRIGSSPRPEDETGLPAFLSLKRV